MSGVPNGWCFAAPIKGRPVEYAACAWSPHEVLCVLVNGTARFYLAPAKRNEPNVICIRSVTITPVPPVSSKIDTASMVFTCAWAPHVFSHVFPATTTLMYASPTAVALFQFSRAGDALRHFGGIQHSLVADKKHSDVRCFAVFWSIVRQLRAWVVLRQNGRLALLALDVEAKGDRLNFAANADMQPVDILLKGESRSVVDQPAPPRAGRKKQRAPEEAPVAIPEHHNAVTIVAIGFNIELIVAALPDGRLVIIDANAAAVVDSHQLPFVGTFVTATSESPATKHQVCFTVTVAGAKQLCSVKWRVTRGLPDSHVQSTAVRVGRVPTPPPPSLKFEVDGRVEAPSGIKHPLHASPSPHWNSMVLVGTHASAEHDLTTLAAQSAPTPPPAQAKRGGSGEVQAAATVCPGRPEACTALVVPTKFNLSLDKQAHVASVVLSLPPEISVDRVQQLCDAYVDEKTKRESFLTDPAVGRSFLQSLLRCLRQFVVQPLPFPKEPPQPGTVAGDLPPATLVAAVKTELYLTHAFRLAQPQTEGVGPHPAAAAWLRRYLQLGDSFPFRVPAVDDRVRKFLRFYQAEAGPTTIAVPCGVCGAPATAFGGAESPVSFQDLLLNALCRSDECAKRSSEASLTGLDPATLKAIPVLQYSDDLESHLATRCTLCGQCQAIDSEKQRPQCLVCGGWLAD